MRSTVRTLFTFLTIYLLFSPAVYAQEQPPAKVTVAQIAKEVVAENRSYIGLLTYDRKSQVSADVSGLVKEVLVTEGDRVKAGDPMVRLDTEILEQEIALKKTRIEQIDLRITLARKNYKRLETLLNQKGTSERNYDDAVYDFQDAQADKKSSELELEKLLIQKRKSVIKAPFDGIILAKNVETGDWVQQGKLLVSVGSTSDLIVKVPIEEAILQFVNKGAEVPVKINAFNRELTGTISQVIPTADVRTKNVFLKISIEPLEDIAENMSATVYIPTSDKKELAIIPRDALIKFQGKDFVYTVKENKAAIMPVNIVTFFEDKVGADNPYFVPGMVVVVEGNERLRPDQPVMVAGEQ